MNLALNRNFEAADSSARGGHSCFAWQHANLADLLDFQNMDVVLRVHHDKSCAAFCEQNLVRMLNNEDFTVHSQFDWAKRALVQGGFKVGQLHAQKHSRIALNRNNDVATLRSSVRSVMLS